MKIPPVSRYRFTTIPGQTWVWDIETTGLDPLKDQVTSIAFKKGLWETVLTRKKTEPEHEFLEKILREWPKTGNFTGWNIEFDRQFLLARLTVNGLEPPQKLKLPMQCLMKHYHRLVTVPAEGPHAKWRKMHEALEEQGLPNKDPHKGSMMPEYWKQGKITRIKNHNLWDVRNEHALMQLLHQKYKAYLHANHPDTPRTVKKTLEQEGSMTT